ncbi:MFS transporter [Burkholderia sp. 22PA0106]|uniref:MFS transporter n=1 Tax=Burkholderia sp. 22PA0106 TaxID=3237371 RepID=UPI0039C09F7D
MMDSNIGYLQAKNDGMSLYRKITWRIVPLLTLCYMVSYLDRVNIAFAKLEMLSDLRFSETVYGVGAGIFFVFYAFFEIPSSILGAKIGPRKWLVRIMIVWGLISASSMFVHTPTQFYLSRCLLGIAEASFVPTAILYLTHWFPTERRSKIIAIFFIALPLSGIIGGPISGWILENLKNVNGLAGWRWLFFIEAMPAVLLGFIVWIFLDDDIRSAKWLSHAEKDALEHEIKSGEKTKVSHASLAQTLSDGKVWLMGSIYFCIVVAQYGVTLWLPTLIKAAGIAGNFHIGLVAAVPYIAAATAMVCFGSLSDRTKLRKRCLMLPMLLGAIGFAGAAIFEANTFLAIGSLSLAAIGAISATPLFWPLPTGFLGNASAAAGIALITAMGNLAGFLSPSMVGWLRDTTHGGRAGMYVLVAFLLLGIAIVSRIPSKLVDK